MLYSIAGNCLEIIRNAIDADNEQFYELNYSSFNIVDIIIRSKRRNRRNTPISIESPDKARRNQHHFSSDGDMKHDSSYPIDVN